MVTPSTVVALGKGSETFGGGQIWIGWGLDWWVSPPCFLVSKWTLANLMNVYIVKYLWGVTHALRFFLNMLHFHGFWSILSASEHYWALLGHYWVATECLLFSSFLVGFHSFVSFVLQYFLLFYVGNSLAELQKWPPGNHHAITWSCFHGFVLDWMDGIDCEHGLSKA